MRFIPPAATTAVLIGALAALLLGCAPSSPLVATPTPMAEPASAPDTIGMPLDEAWEALTEAGFTVDAADIREDRSIWDRGNWVVRTQDANGGEVGLGVEKSEDPICWEQATNCDWAPIFVFDATATSQSETFALDGGPARLTYAVTAETTTEGRRTADIYFQDVRLDTESSRIDTIVHVDRPSEGVESLGERSGSFWVATHIREHDVSGVAIHVVVEQMQPREE